jgi:hypothetical protein
MRLVTVSTSTSTVLINGIVIPLDIHREDFNVNIGISKVSGSPTINVQYTMQNILEQGVSAGNVTWFPITALTSVSTTLAGTLTAPAHAVRFLQPEVGDVRIFIIQAGLA